MANLLELIVLLTDKGSAKKLSSDLDTASGSLNKVASASRNASKESDVHANALGKGVVGAGSAGRDFGKLAKTIDGGSGSLVGAYATLAANLFAVSAAFNQLKNAAQVQQLEEGLARMGDRMGTTLSVTAKNIRDLSGGMLTLEQSFRSTAQAATAGISSKSLKELAQVAKDASYALGRDMGDSMDRLTKGVAKLEPELLDELGITTRLDEASKVYAKSLGKTVDQLSSTEKHQGFLNAVLAEGKAKLGGISESAGSTGLNKLGVAVQDVVLAFEKFINIAAGPLAALLSSSPGGIVGGAILFASTISGQLIPGLKNVTKEAITAASAIRTEAVGSLLKLKDMSAGTQVLGPLVAQFEKGTVNAESLNIQLNVLKQSIAEQEAALIKNTIATEEGLQIAAARRIEIDKQIALYEQLAVTTVKVAEAEQLYHVAQAEGAASAGNALLAVKETAAAKLAAAIATDANTVAEEAGIIATTGASLAFSELALTAKTAGIAILGALGIIGIIITVLSMLYDAAKAAYKAMIGEDVVKAQENLSETMKHLSDRVTEYNRIKAATTSDAAKELAISKLVTNNLIEQTDNYAALATAIRVKNNETEKSISKPTAAYKTQTGLQAIQSGAAGAEIAARNAELAKSGQDTLKKLYESGIPEYKKAIDDATVSQGGFKKVLQSKDPEVYGQVLSALNDKIKNYGPVIDNLSTSIKGLNDAYTAFAKSATPTTTFDPLTLALGKTSAAITESVIEMQKGVVTADKLNSVLKGIDTSKMAAPKNTQDKAVLDDAIKKNVELQSIGLQIADREKLHIKNDQELNNLKDHRKDIETYFQVNGAKILLSAQSLVSAENEIYQTYKNQSLEKQGQLTLAQAQLSLISSVANLTGKDVERRIDAENRVKNIQIAQLKLQLDSQKALVLNAQAKQKELENNISNNAELKKTLGIVTDISKLDTSKAITSVMQKLVEMGDPTKDTTAALKQQRIDLTKLLQDLQARKVQEDGISSSMAAQRSLQASITAIAITRESEASKRAKRQASDVKTLAQYAAADLESATAAQSIEEKRAAIKRALAGEDLSYADNLTKIIESQNALYDKQIAATYTANVDKLAQLNAEKVDAIAKLGINSDTVKYYDQQIAKQITLGNIALQNLETDRKSAIITAAKLETNIQLVSVQKDLNSELLNSVTASNDLVDAQVALEKAKGKKQLGRDLTAEETGAIEAKYSDKRLKNIEEERKLKIQIIDLETALLVDKYRSMQEQYAISLKIAEAEQGVDSDRAKRYRDILKSLDKLVGKNPAADEMSSKVAESAKDKTVPVISKDSVKDLADATKLARAGTVVNSSVDTLAKAIGDAVASAINKTKPSEKPETATTAADKAEAPSASSGDITDVQQIVVSNKATSDSTGDTGSIQARGETQKATATAQAQTKAIETPNIPDIHDILGKFSKDMAALGPAGETASLISAGANNMIGSISKIGGAIKDMSSAKDMKGFASGFTAAASAASSILNDLSAIAANSSKQKIAGIDAEIAAEQKRDGKSTQSVAKIKALEAQKDAAAKKAFETNKKIQMAQTVIATATAAMGMLAAYPGPPGWIMAAAVAAMGAMELATIAGTSYQSTAGATSAVAQPTLSIGKKSDSVDLAKTNVNAGGESGFVTGAQGTGNTASDFRRAPYGTKNTGRAGVIVGEKGPELFTPNVPGSVTPNNQVQQTQPINATINIHAIDSAGVEQLLTDKRGHIIGMLREAANANGQKFLENVDTKKYKQGGRKL